MEPEAHIRCVAQDKWVKTSAAVSFSKVFGATWKYFCVVRLLSLFASKRSRYLKLGCVNCSSKLEFLTNWMYKTLK